MENEDQINNKKSSGKSRIVKKALRILLLMAGGGLLGFGVSMLIPGSG